MGLSKHLQRIQRRSWNRPQPKWYPPIDSAVGEIRLLHLAPAEWEDEIKIFTSKTKALFQREYEALSYTWGTWDDSQSISVDGESGFLVTRNLWLALRRLRYRDHVRILWIDAICINQNDIEERTQQIQLMGKIYRSASTVIIWLGECFDTAVDASHAYELGVNKFEIHAYALREAVRNTSPLWWTRSWVVQEFSMARKTPQVHFGPFEVDWDTFGVIVSQQHIDTGDQPSLARAQYSLDAVRKSVQDGDASLLELLDLLMDSQSTDVRDNVYSLLGLIGDFEAGIVKATYDDGVGAAFAKATYASITASKSYGILGFLSFTGSRPPGMPTWAFNFAPGGDRHVRTQIWNRKVAHDSKSLTWTKRTNTHRLPELAFYPRDLSLTIQGLVFDEIVSVELFSDAESSAMSGETYAHAVERLRGLVHSLPNHHPYLCLMEPSKHRSVDLSAISNDANASLHWSSLLRDIFGRWYSALQRPDPYGTQFSTPVYQLFARPEESPVPMKSFTSIFVTKRGFLGVGSGQVNFGDIVTLFYGCQSPTVLRSHNRAYQFQGFAFINGIMNEELLTEVPGVELEEKSFKLL